MFRQGPEKNTQEMLKCLLSEREERRKERNEHKALKNPHFGFDKQYFCSLPLLLVNIILHLHLLENETTHTHSCYSQL